MKIIALVGSIRRSSYNRKLATFVQQRYVEQMDVTIPDLGALPFYDQDIELEAPADVQAFKQTIMDADGVIFVTPEYNHSIPGVLGNAIDWLSRVERPLTGKPVMILGATLGPLGTVRAQSHLRQILDSPGVAARVLPGDEFLLSTVQNKMNIAGDITDSKSVEWLDHCVADYLKFAHQLAASN
ncbi:NAD(P)H-dependent oxidoreductase [Lactiplantibacillus paraplantarum]|uniref:NADPH-dependent FMN reductase n=1 Tax=Lactiplantibacillus paraplantarum TaxID=60520 RepID=UPI000512AB18|nr:NADPH-dependent FMN reductase [Lactiplantibacillus paraplantarum]OAX75953.1 NADPH-dependent FMN reductase [Lactiplantibacillus plantarum]ALO05213.1 NADPH-dependent FMN reductase [Lactiplantibacillus paraplantarum]KGE75673.1 NADPH-dependent FMN reductase [Lactiplantibacillus paraplantarum]MCT4456291.1 NAD(P)H-dependent oxidoreductase [Lactiplantibacillus paraplantarum]MCW1911438.1 NAD(P)H-dependent oxidoreductase [Lactiplantibacillus paraplantarum]